MQQQPIWLTLCAAFTLALGGCAQTPVAEAPAAEAPAASTVSPAATSATEDAATPETAASELPAAELRLELFIDNARKGICDAVEKDIKAGGLDIDAVDVLDQTALIAAANGGHIACMRMLIDAGADVNRANGAQWTPLMYVTHAGSSLDAAKLLVEKGANVNARSHNQGTPLIYASFIGAEGIIDLLLANKADVNLENEMGFSALNAALEKGFKNIAEKLRRAGAKESAAKK